jgi:RNA polymerase sigma factor (sigma-70 family)
VALSAGGNVLAVYRQWEWMVRYYTRHVPSHVRDDAEQAARIGLWRAARTWRARRSSFPSWARNCIRWEVADELRRLDPLPRGDRDYLTAFSGWQQQHSTTEGVWPSTRDAEAAGWDMRRIAATQLPGELLTDPPSATTTEEEAVTSITVSEWLDRLAGLPFPEWQVVSLRWVEDWPVAAVADYLGVSEATVFKRTASARKRLLR